MQKQEGQYPRQSSAERKEALYNDIIEYYDKGKVGVAWCVPSGCGMSFWVVGVACPSGGVSNGCGMSFWRSVSSGCGMSFWRSVSRGVGVVDVHMVTLL